MSKNTFTLGQVVAMAALTLSGSAFAAGQEGMQVVRDATTGELRAPNAAEYQALQAQAAQSQSKRGMAAPAAASMVVGTKARKGTTAYAVPEESVVYSVMTRNADGTLDHQCVTGEHAATHAIQNQAAVSLHKEHKNEVQ
jgi:hypothetical protein